MCCSFAGDIEMGLPICLTTLYLLICEMCKIIKCSIEKYHGTHSYRMKWYKKFNLLNEYREKVVITETKYKESRLSVKSIIKNNKAPAVLIISLKSQKLHPYKYFSVLHNNIAPFQA